MKSFSLKTAPSYSIVSFIFGPETEQRVTQLILIAESRRLLSSERRCSFIICVFINVFFFVAGPLGPLPNVTSSDLGLKEGTLRTIYTNHFKGSAFLKKNPYRITSYLTVC